MLFAWRLVSMAALWGLGNWGAMRGAEPLSIIHWGTDQGLGPGAVGSMLQTRNGYMWLGSEEGLMRFDGVRCTVFNSKNTPELKAKLVTALHEDSRGGLWVGTGGGGLTYRSATGGWTHYGESQGLMNGRISALTQDSEGHLWVGTDGGGIFVRAGEGFQPFAGNDQLPGPQIDTLVPASGGGIWVGTGAPLLRIRKGALDLEFAPSGEIPASSTVIAAGEDGTLWVGGKDGLYVLHENRFRRVDTDLDLGRAHSLCLAAEGRVWVGTNRGLVLLEAGKLTRYTAEDGLSGNLIHAIYRDGEASLWIASNVTGVDQIRATKFTSISTERGLSHPVATAIYEDREGVLWVGSHRGLNRIDRKGISHWTQSDGLSANLVFTLCEASEGGLWIGTFNGLNRMVDGQFQVFRTTEGLPSPVIWCLYRDRSGQVWAGTARGLVRIRGDQFEVFNHANSGLSHNDVRSICEDAEGRLWVGTSYGLNRWENGRFTQFLEGSPGQPFNAVLALHSDGEGALWIGTMENGLFCYWEGAFRHFRQETGLHDNMIFSILEDDLGHLWMSCNYGVFRVRKAGLEAFAHGRTKRIECAVFGKSDGLPSTECNGTFQPAAWKSKDGRLWFPTAKGVAVVNPRDLRRNHRPPPVVIEETRVNGRPVALSASTRLGPGVNEIIIQYTGLSFIAPEQARFKYRLEGLDPDWLAETIDRSARYTHLPPGEYRFRVIACNNDGIWSAQEAALAFQVLPFWWQTRWFMGLTALALAGSAGGAARLWTIRNYRRRLAEVERQHALERERMRIATDLHDDVGSHLGAIALLGASAKHGAEGEAAREFAEIQRLAEATAEKMRDIVWFIDSSEDELRTLVFRMKEAAGRLLAGLDWEFQAPEILPCHKLSTEFKRHFFLIFKESLHNIRKHSRATQVRVQLDLSVNWLELAVLDNGIGLAEPERAGGLGLSSMRRRAAGLGWKLALENRPEGGLAVRLSASLPPAPAGNPGFPSRIRGMYFRSNRP